MPEAVLESTACEGSRHPRKRTRLFKQMPAPSPGRDSTTLPDQNELGANKLLQNGSWLSSNTRSPSPFSPAFRRVGIWSFAHSTPPRCGKQARRYPAHPSLRARVVTPWNRLQLKRPKPRPPQRAHTDPNRYEPSSTERRNSTAAFNTPARFLPPRRKSNAGTRPQVQSRNRKPLGVFWLLAVKRTKVPSPYRGAALRQISR